MFIDEVARQFLSITPSGIFNASNVSHYYFLNFHRIATNERDLKEMFKSIRWRIPYARTWFEWESPVGLTGAYLEELSATIPENMGLSIQLYGQSAQKTRLMAEMALESDALGNFRGCINKNLLLDSEPLWFAGRDIKHEGIWYTAFPVLGLALQLLHCRNVQIVKERIPKPHNKSKARRQRGYHEEYYVLQIDPMRKILDTEGDAQKTGIRQALHICRGHFKTYTAEAPLLGRTTGTFWWADHVRGDPDVGVIDKDYAFKPIK